MKPTTAVFAAIAAALITGPAAASDKSVSATKLAADPGAYTLDLGNGKVGQIKRIQPPRGTEKTCNVDMASLQKLARKEFRKHDGKTGISIPIHMAFLQPGRDSPFMTPTCHGAGGGCTIWVWIL